MCDRSDQETRNKQTRKRNKPFPALLPQDPTVCQTLNPQLFPPPFQATL